MTTRTVTGAEVGKLAEALTEPEVDLLGDLTAAWGAAFPRSRFSGRTVATARMSVSPQEAVELAKRAYALGALSQRTDGGDA